MRSIIKSLFIGYFLITTSSSVLGEDYASYFPTSLTSEQKILIDDIDYLASIAPKNTVLEFCPLCTEDEMEEKALELAKYHQEMPIVQASILNVPSNMLMTFEVVNGSEISEISSSEFARIFLKVHVDRREAMSDVFAKSKANIDEANNSNESSKDKGRAGGPDNDCSRKSYDGCERQGVN